MGTQSVSQVVFNWLQLKLGSTKILILDVKLFVLILEDIYFVGTNFDLHFNLISTSLPLKHFHIAEMQVKTK